MPRVSCCRLLGFAIAAVMLGACGAPREDAVALCDIAAEWRDAAQSLEVIATSVDRQSLSGHTRMSDAFSDLGNFTLRLPNNGPDEDRLAISMERLMAEAQRWLSDAFLYYLATREDSDATGAQRVAAYEAEETARLEWNSATRVVNSQLLTLCDIEPIEFLESADSSSWAEVGQQVPRL